MTDDLHIELRGDPPPAEGLGAAQQMAAPGRKFDEDRYSRFRLIPWWDQERLKNARVMVVGAGALGNEIVKNLALLGIGCIFVVDMDRIENSNLSRSVLFRSRDEGRFKAEVVAESAADLNPDCTVRPFVGDVVHDVGLGVFRAVDLVIGGLDNREARLWVNQSCWRVNRPWVDGAIEVLNGVVRVFVPPDSACYECTMNENDYRMLAKRKSCNLLSRDQMLEGKTPTTPTTSAVIAGMQCQEALKLLHGRPELPVLAGRGFYFNGVTHDSFVVNYPRREGCLSHETHADIRETDWRAGETTVNAALERARQDLGPDATLSFFREIAVAFRCEACNTAEGVFRALGRITERDARCPACGGVRAVDSTHMIAGDEPYLQRTLAGIGIPAFDIIGARSGTEEVCYELTGDKHAVMGSPHA
ncbi:MAG TPA: ThiF family adenylyltransferase [Armatimonadota bacterium]|jgi:adenylyltransferase/sulfurtransferase